MISEHLQDQFICAYVEAIYFTETGDIEQPKSDIEESPEFMEKVNSDCSDFLNKYANLIEVHLFEQAGHDYWLTRNGHGAGFWDRDGLYGSNDTVGDIGDYLSEQVRYTEVYAFEGNDGLLYLV